MENTQCIEFSEDHIRIFELVAVKKQLRENPRWYFIQKVTPEIKSIPFFEGKLDNADEAYITIGPISSRLDELVEDDIRRGKEFFIHHVQMANHTAIALFAEGRIHTSHLMQHKEYIDKNGERYIHIPGVFFAGKPYGVVIYSEQSPVHGRVGFATIDQSGNIV